MKPETDWNIHILSSFDKEPEIKIIDAVPDIYRIIFITCTTWEEAEKTKKQIEQEIRHDTEN